MTNRENSEQPHSSSGPENDDVPLWYALAMFISEDTSTSLPKIDKITDKILRENAKYFEEIRVPSRVLFAFSIALLSYALWVFLSTHTLANLSLGGSVLFISASIGLSYFWHRVQYGKKLWPDEPVKVPHDTDQLIDEFIAILQKPQANGKSIAYYRSRFAKEQVFIDRRQFFGALRYLLFSERPKARSAVTDFWNGLAAPANIYIHQLELNRIVASRRGSPSQGLGTDQMSVPVTSQRRRSPGRTREYPYDEVKARLLETPESRKIDLSDRETALEKIKELFHRLLQKRPNQRPSKKDNYARKDYIKHSDVEELYEELKKIPKS